MIESVTFLCDNNDIGLMRSKFKDDFQSVLRSLRTIMFSL